MYFTLIFGMCERLWGFFIQTLAFSLQQFLYLQFLGQHLNLINIYSELHHS